MKAVVAFKKSARTLRTLPFQILPVCDASSCTSPEDQARAHIFAQRQSTVHQGATWWSKKAFEGVPAEHRQLLDALLRAADHGSGHTGQRHGCRRDLFFAFAHNRSPHTVQRLTFVQYSGGGDFAYAFTTSGHLNIANAVHRPGGERGLPTKADM